MLLSLLNCSIDTNSNFWDNNSIKDKKKMSEIKFNYELSYDEFKNNAIEYGKISEYPKLDE
tara:strand:- start:798 stop:980 length:183 start_codon:yes stop_codon:yes gene_type:complete